MWTPTALASEARALAGTVWRAVEHQHSNSTRKIVDTQAEQHLLEQILDETKPPYPPAAASLHYLLKTPFRYSAVNPNGSRFRRPYAAHGVFYASEQVRTALAEFAYHRLRFFAASPATPLPRNEERVTAFTALYAVDAGLDLTAPPFVRDRARWTARGDYTATQALAEAARAANVGAVRYESVRDAAGGCNVALLTPSAFAAEKPLAQHTWYLYLAPTEVSCVRAQADAETWVFPRAQFEDAAAASN